MSPFPNSSPWMTDPEAFVDTENCDIHNAEDLERVFKEHNAGIKEIEKQLSQDDREALTEIFNDYAIPAAENTRLKRLVWKFEAETPDGPVEEKTALEEARDAADKAAKDAIPGIPARAEPHLQEYPDIFIQYEEDLLINATMGEMGSVKILKRHGVAEEDCQLLYGLYKNIDLLREMFLQNAPKQGNWIAALKIYIDIMKLPDVPTLQDAENPYYLVHSRLAMAVALELAKERGDVKPTERFLHFVNAHLNGELDPAFSYFTTYEYRWIMCSGKSHTDMQWLRDYLWRFRPHQIIMDDSKMRYCEAVDTEVGYRKPYKDEHPKTCADLASSGGKCGPRAWFGRAICQAFGIPVWGYKIPGHAMMSHWTNDQGWIHALGPKSWDSAHWELMRGEHFLDRINTRAYVWNSEDPAVLQEYYKKVILSCCMAACKGEFHPGHGEFVGSDWRRYYVSIYRCQYKLYGEQAKDKPENHIRNSEFPRQQQQISDEDVVKTRVEQYKEHMATATEQEVIMEEDDAILIPTGLLTGHEEVIVDWSFPPTKPGVAEKQIMMGKQVSTAEYELPTDMMGDKSYEISFLICTVHETQRDLIVTINGEDTVELPMDYTVGEWSWTPAKDLPAASEYKTMKLSRKDADFDEFGIAIKTIKLIAK